MTSSPDDLLVEADESRPPDPTPNFAFDDGTGPVRQDPPAPAAAPEASGPLPDMLPNEFDPRWREPFQGLVYIGDLTYEFTLYGHRFRISTPGHADRLAVGPMHAPYKGTITSETAFETIITAAYLRAVDGEELPQPIMNNAPTDAALRDRYDWVVKNLKRQVIGKIYEKCLVLEEQVDGVLTAMGNPPG